MAFWVMAPEVVIITKLTTLIKTLTNCFSLENITQSLCWYDVNLSWILMCCKKQKGSTNCWNSRRSARLSWEIWTSNFAAIWLWAQRDMTWAKLASLTNLSRKKTDYVFCFLFLKFGPRQVLDVPFVWKTKYCLIFTTRFSDCIIVWSCDQNAGDIKIPSREFYAVILASYVTERNHLMS